MEPGLIHRVLLACTCNPLKDPAARRVFTHTNATHCHVIHGQGCSTMQEASLRKAYNPLILALDVHHKRLA